MNRDLRPNWAPVAVCAACVAGLLAAWIAVDTLLVIVRTYSPLPFWDSWGEVFDYEALRAGAFSFADLFRQNNEHRIAFARLVFFTDFLLFRGANVFSLAAIVAIQSLHGLLLARLAGDLRRPLALGAAALALALMLSIGPWENMVCGFQVQFVAVYAFATAAFVLLAGAVRATGGGRATRLAGCALCVVLSTYSMANGLAAGGIAVALALAISAPRWMTGMLAALTALLAAAYFHGYQTVAEHSPPAYALSHPLDYLLFVAAYAGNAASALLLRPPTALFASAGYALPLYLGFAALALSAASLVRTAWRRARDPVEAVLVAVTAFVVLTAAVTALGRLSFGLHQAYAPRYHTPTHVLWAAQAIYWTRAMLPGPSWRRLAVGVVQAGVFVLLVWIQWHVPSHEIEPHRARLALAADAIVSGMSEDDALRGDFPDPPMIAPHLATLRRDRLSAFAAPRADWIGRPISTVARLAPQDCRGAVETALVPAENPRDDAHVTGWAWDNRRHAPPRRLVLTNAAGLVTGLGTAGLPRPDIGKALGRRGAGRTGWAGVARADGGPVRVFAVLANGSACEIGAKAVSPSPSRLLQIQPGQAGALLPVAVSMQGGWTAGGVGADIPTQTAQPRPAETVFGSWSGDDGKQGTISFGPFTTQGRGVAVALLTGADTAGQSIVLKDAQTGVVYARLLPAARREWVWRRVRIPPPAAGRPLLLQGVDQGGGPGQWLGLTAPHAVSF